MSTMQNKELVRKFTEEVFNKGDVDALDGFLSPDFVAHYPGFQGEEVAYDVAGFKQSMQQSRAAIRDFRIAIDSLIAEGDTVAARTTYSGVHTGSFMGIPPTNKRLSWHVMHFFRIANGKIAESWHSPDQLGMLQQLGVVADVFGVPAGR